MTRHRLISLAVLLAVAACSGSDGSPTANGGSISISLSAGSVTIAQGANGNVTVTLARSGGFAGAATVALSGTPPGVTANGTTIAAGSSSATIDLQVGGSAAAGTSTLTVRASGSGVSDATATLTLVITAAQSGGFTLSLNPATLSVQQGGTAQTTVNLARTAPFTGTVALSASGLSTGVTASFAPSDASGATATLTITAASNAATGTNTVTIRGTGAGVTDQTVSLSLSVTAASSGGGVAWPVCPGALVPIWFAAQDGNGPWTRVPISTGNRFVFDITSARGGVAYVTQDGSGGFTLSVLYFTATEIAAQATGLCNELGTRTVNGSVAGLGAMQQATIALGGSSAVVVPGTPTAFTMQNVRAGVVDLLAARSQLSASGSTADKLILRRDLDPASGSTLPVLDFGGSEAFDPVQSTATVANLNGDISYVANWYHTANGFVNSFFAGVVPTTAATHQWPGIPADRQQNGDLHVLQVFAMPAGTTPSSLRTVATYFRAAGDRTITLGPLLNTPTVTTVATSPYVRFRAQLASQPEYDRVWSASYIQISGTPRTVALTATAGYLGSPATVDLAVPDLTAAAQWDSNWGPRTGVQTQWSVGATDWSGDATSGPVVEGGTLLNAVRMGTISP